MRVKALEQAFGKDTLSIVILVDADDYEGLFIKDGFDAFAKEMMKKQKIDHL